MDLILWRHADADPGGFDLARELTPKGRDQAARVASWLRERLPSRFDVLSSPAVRAEQTAAALVPKFKTEKHLAPGAKVQTILKTADWPNGEGTVIMVGHQPDLGRTAAFLMSGRQTEWHIEKGALWWFSDATPVVLRTVVSPELL
jgi:phosphohistidine phosphatase